MKAIGSENGLSPQGEVGNPNSFVKSLDCFARARNDGGFVLFVRVDPKSRRLQAAVPRHWDEAIAGAGLFNVPD